MARYWDGFKWTLQTKPIAEVKQIVRQEWLAVTAEEGKQKSRVTAGVLGILLGSLGIHRFYLGNIALGLWQLFLFLSLMIFGAFWLVTLWGVVEGIMILSKNKAFERSASGVPLK